MIGTSKYMSALYWNERRNATALQDFNSNRLIFSLFSSHFCISISEAAEDTLINCAGCQCSSSLRISSMISTRIVSHRKSIPAFTDMHFHYFAIWQCIFIWGSVHQSEKREVHDKVMVTDKHLETLFCVATSSFMPDIGSLVCEK